MSGGKHADVSECMRQPEVNLGCHSSDATSLEETVLLTGLDSPGRLIWLAGNHQRSANLYLPSPAIRSAHQCPAVSNEY